MKQNGHGIPIRVLCLSLIFVLAGAAGASADTLSLTFKADAPQLAKDASGYDVPRLTDFSMSAVPGRPMLPRRVFNIALPPDADWASLRLTVTAIDEQQLPGFFTVRTCPPDSAWKDGQWLTSLRPRLRRAPARREHRRRLAAQEMEVREGRVFALPVRSRNGRAQSGPPGGYPDRLLEDRGSGGRGRPPRRPDGRCRPGYFPELRRGRGLVCRSARRRGARPHALGLRHRHDRGHRRRQRQARAPSSPTSRTWTTPSMSSPRRPGTP